MGDAPPSAGVASNAVLAPAEVQRTGGRVEQLASNVWKVQLGQCRQVVHLRMLERTKCRTNTCTITSTVSYDHDIKRAHHSIE